MGFQKDLHLSPKEFYNCLMMFCQCINNKLLLGAFANGQQSLDT